MQVTVFAVPGCPHLPLLEERPPTRRDSRAASHDQPLTNSEPADSSGHQPKIKKDRG
jgi:hypothetical protein